MAAADDGALGRFLMGMRSRGLRDARLLDAVERTPRAGFLPAEISAFAYGDMTLPLDCGEETGSPFAIAAAVAALDVSAGHRVLEIGTGSGWQTALLAALGRGVVSIERWRALAAAAETALGEAGAANAVVIHGDGAQGLAEGAPYDRIIVNAAVAVLPAPLPAQLAPGGVIVAPLRDGAQTMLTRWTFSERGLAQVRLGSWSGPDLLRGAALAL